MVAWTPSNLSTAPRLWEKPSGRTFSGSTLTAFANAGSDGGSATVSGSPQKGTAYNGVDSVRWNATTKSAAWALGAVTTGTVYVLSVQSSQNATPPNDEGPLSKNWASASGLAMAFYARITGSPLSMQGLYYNGSAITSGAGSNTAYGDTNLHILEWQVGSSPALFIDGVSSTLDVLNNSTAVPSLAAATWLTGYMITSGSPAQPSNEDVVDLILLDYFPTTLQRQQLEGWATWSYAGNGSLVPVTGQPFRWAAPDTAGLTTPYIRNYGPQSSRAGAGTITMTLPTYVAGDALILVVQTSNQPISTPSGYSVPTGGSQGTGTTGAAGSTCLQVFYKVAGGSEVGPTITISGDHILAVVFSAANCDTTTPVNISAGSVLASAATAVSIGGVTSTVANGLAVMIASWATDTATLQGSAPTNATLSGPSTIGQNSVTDGNGGGFAIYAGLKATAGATGTTTATLATSSVQGLFAMVLIPPQPSVIALSSKLLAGVAGRASPVWRMNLASTAPAQAKGRGLVSQVINMGARVAAQIGLRPALLIPTTALISTRAGGQAKGRGRTTSTTALAGSGATMSEGRGVGTMMAIMTAQANVQGAGRGFISQVISMGATVAAHVMPRLSTFAGIPVSARATVQGKARPAGSFSTTITGRSKSQTGGPAAVSGGASVTAGRARVSSAARAVADYVIRVSGSTIADATGRLGVTGATALSGRTAVQATARFGTFSMVAGLFARAAASIRGRAPTTPTTALTSQAGGVARGVLTLTGATSLTAKTSAQTAGQGGFMAGVGLTARTSVRAFGRSRLAGLQQLTARVSARIAGRPAITSSRPDLGVMTVEIDATAQMDAEADQL